MQDSIFPPKINRLSVAHFQAEIEKRRHQKRAKFNTLGAELLLSPAFLDASPDCRLLVTYIYSMKIEMRQEYDKPPEGLRARGRMTARTKPKRKWSLHLMETFTLTCNELMAAGLKKSNAGRARSEAWRRGFINTIRSGTRDVAGLYAFSERWHQYPHGHYQPDGQQPPGIQLYSESARDALKRVNASRKRKIFCTREISRVLTIHPT